MPSLQERTKTYYRTRESRLGYRLILGGTKHFGYYPEGQEHISMKRAMRRMEDQLGRAINLPAGSKVLDAGCGMGRVAVNLAQDFGYQIEGIDLLDFNIKEATRYSAARHQPGVSFRVGDYTKLPFPNDSFDAVYTMETLYHAPNYDEALSELRRVLKPNGKLVMFEYSIETPGKIKPEFISIFKDIVEHSAMHAFPPFQHDSFEPLLGINGFSNVTQRDITSHVVPMLRRFHHLAFAWYYLQRSLNRPKATYINTFTAFHVYRLRQYWHYNIVTATAS